MALKWTSLALLALLILAAGFAVWVRTRPVPAAMLSARPGPDAPGAHPLQGGFKLVLPEAPPGTAARLREVALATPRTVEAAPGAYVTRSALWGFPDVTRIWRDEAGALHIYAHLVIGSGDFGVNRARVELWVAAAGL